MKRALLPLLLAVPLSAQQQAPPKMRYTAPMAWDAEWAGVTERVYSPQWSPNLRYWVYLPTMRFGEAMHGIGGTVEGAKGFIRLAYYDDPALANLAAAEQADADGDGIANLDEVAVNFTDPFASNVDTDGDGLYDGWENAHGFDPQDDGNLNPDNGADGDPDHDGLTNLEEQTLGTDPNNPDTDADGITDGGEADQGTNANDPEERPVAEWFVLTGDLEADVEKSRSRTITIPAGESRLVVVALHSEEYPYYTENTSEFNDQLEWDIRPQGKDAVTGIVDVNSRHVDWDLALVDGVQVRGFSPTHIETTAKHSAPGDSDLTIEIDLSVTNIGDGALPSTVMVGVLPVEVRDNVEVIEDTEAPGGADH